MIQASNLSKKYGKKQVVTDLNFTIEKGKVTGFLGPNGAGKSTTMRLLLGLDKGSGHTLYDEKPLNHYARPSEVVGILLEAKAFHPTRTARNHLRVLAAASGVPESRVDEVLEIVGLHDVAKKKPGKFSLGMSQRLGIAAAILNNPTYLFLDEPANGLDPEGIAWLRSFIKSYAAQDKGVFVSSHLLSEMSLMADNIVVIGKGKLIADTTVQEILDGSSGRGIFVRASSTAKLQQTLKTANLPYTSSHGGLLVQASSTDQVGKLAFKAGVQLLELSSRSASLEDAFLELTADSQEYKTGVKQ